MKYYAAAAFIACLATPVLAEGDIEKGEKTFKKCKSCHQIVSDSGEVIAKGGSTGPNLYGLAGRKAGSVEGFRYGDDLVAAGEAGLVWNEEQLAKYVQNPRDFLRDYLDDSKAKSNMSFRLKKGGEDVYAYLAQFGAAEPAAETEEAPASE
ncbi:cytochrome c family protein [Phaeobacter sp. HF9A]|uniref:c-type cytochrome n=1 Tax=Phaeobacter sp. HF9A TaxID=2721561 RepID=UPI001431940F|nr:c-type cytochrome [Phaeobacter sp. HF9A]NIZ14320.1 cytochrome C [Phaeobacter sp. HF9A]